MNQQETHEALWRITKQLPQDYEPYGQQKRSGDEEDDEPSVESHTGYYGDCSSGCRWFAELAGKRGQDWGVCTSVASHRSGLLTFEHQGCLWFDLEERVEGQE